MTNASIAPPAQTAKQAQTATQATSTNSGAPRSALDTGFAQLVDQTAAASGPPAKPAGEPGAPAAAAKRPALPDHALPLPAALLAAVAGAPALPPPAPPLIMRSAVAESPATPPGSTIHREAKRPHQNDREPAADNDGIVATVLPALAPQIMPIQERLAGAAEADGKLASQSVPGLSFTGRPRDAAQDAADGDRSIDLSAAATAIAAHGAAPAGSAEAGRPAIPPPAGLIAGSASAQVAQVLVGLSAGGGAHRVTVQLAPDELGRVQISVTRGADGAAAIDVTAERRDTLALVQADAAHLHAALDLAGVAAHGRTLHFHLAEPPVTSVSAPDPAASRSDAPQGAVRPAAATHDAGQDLDTTGRGSGFSPGGGNPQASSNGQPGHNSARQGAQYPSAITQSAAPFIQAEHAGVLTIQHGRLRAIDLTA